MVTKFQTPVADYWDREQDFLRLLMKMESRGVEIDERYCRNQRAIGEARMQDLHNEFGELSPSSPKKMKLLFERAGVPLLEDHKTKKGAYSFNKEAMEDYDRLLELQANKYSGLAKSILEWRGWMKTVSSNYTPYLELVSPDGRLRCNYNQAGTKTGRLSCNNPNLQQIPRSSVKPWNGGLKKAFRAKPGFVLVSNDYSQLEFRLGASDVYSGQKNLIEIFNRSLDTVRYSKIERDIFIQMCIEMGLDPEDARQGMKTLTYAKAFGAGKVKIAIMLGDVVPQWVRDAYWDKTNPAYRDAWAYISELPSAKFYDDWEKKYSRMAGFSKFVNKAAEERGFIQMWTGRRRRFDKFEHRKAYNSLIQGGGAEIVKSAMLRLEREIDNDDCQMLLQVHDSVVFEIRESKVDYYVPMIKEVMSRVEEEKNFGVYFATEEEFWGLAA
jgi:DNA polymerase-1